MTATQRICPIATLTLNPAVDATYEISRLLADQKTHARAVRYDPGGNGINVSRALKTLDIPAKSFCVTAGEIGQLFQRLVRGAIANLDAEHIRGETRINVALQERDTAAQYEVSAIGPTLSAHHLEHLSARMLAASANGIAVLTGSVPPGVDDMIYARLTERVREQGGRPVVDTYGALLRQAIAARPFLIKPNRYELEQFCGEPLSTREAVAAQARRLQHGGIDYLCVSLGRDGALLCAPDNTYFAQAPSVTINSTVGAGDSMVAGLVCAFARGDTPAQALRLGIACGTGTTQHPGTELFTMQDVQTLLPHIEVSALDI